jgi:hypothetical protein
MYLFSRTGQLVGNARAGMQWAVEMTAYVNEHTDNHPLGLWLTQFGQPVGSVGWTTMVDSHVDLQATFAWIQEDDGYFELLAKGEAFMATPPVDYLRQIVVASDGDAAGVGANATITTAVAANGKLAEAMAWGAEVSTYVASLTGLVSYFLADTYGSFGQMTWIGVAPDMAAVDAAGAKMQGDAGYMERLGAIGDLFVPGSGHNGIVTRIA